MTEEQRRWLLLHLNNNRGGGTNSGGGVLTPYEFVAQSINLDSSIGITTRDGARTFINDLTGRIWCVGGWNPTQWPVTESTNQQWYSDDNGETFTQAADAPWSERHNYGLQKKSDGTIILFGGDDVNGTPPKDSWTWSPITELWTNITMDWGLTGGERTGYGQAIDASDAIYMIGGSIDNNIVKSTDNGATWTVFATIPTGYEVGLGYSCWHNNELYNICGLNSVKNFKVSASGVVTTLPDLTGEMATRAGWCEIVSFKGRILWIDGTGSGGNKTGVRISEDGMLTWQKIGSFFMRASHARAIEVMTIDSEEVVFAVTGNQSLDSNKITAEPYVALANEAVYSVTKAVSGYVGNCLKVRRSSDNTELDIGFTGNDLDTTSLLSFVGAGDGFITAWYDQSGNGHDLTEAVQANQALIVSAGVLETDNGLPAINFNTTSKRLSLPAPINLTSKYSISTVMNLAAGYKIFMLGNTANCYGFFNYDYVIHNNGNANPFQQETATVFTSGSQKLLEIYRNRMQSEAYQNGTLKTMLPSGSTGGLAWYWDTDFYFLQIGQEYGFGYAFTGKIQELNIKCGVIEPTSHTTIQADINARFNIY